MRGSVPFALPACLLPEVAVSVKAAGGVHTSGEPRPQRHLHRLGSLPGGAPLRSGWRQGRLGPLAEPRLRTDSARPWAARVLPPWSHRGAES